jgi:hypothetical protein
VNSIGLYPRVHADTYGTGVVFTVVAW